MTTELIQRPIDATLSVTKAARLLSVTEHDRTWSDQGRLRYRINPRETGYRRGDLGGSGNRPGTPIGPGQAALANGPGAMTPMSAATPAAEAVGYEASAAMRAARDYAQTATWAAQLQSIQQLGNRLNRLRSVREIGNAIATELRQLIDYHNVRVYRVEGDELIPVAMLGQVGEYVDETPDQLRVKVGAGIPAGSQPGMPDPARCRGDARPDDPGTEDDLDESCSSPRWSTTTRSRRRRPVEARAAPVRGRSPPAVIYASFAAGVANADSTELLAQRSAALGRQLRSQRELLGSPGRS